VFAEVGSAPAKRSKNRHPNGIGSFNHKVGNSVFNTHGHVHRLPLVKHAAFEDEQKHRITISEHLGGSTAMQRTALTTLGKPFSDFALGPLQMLDARFRYSGL
jgi:hypothetical protein